MEYKQKQIKIENKLSFWNHFENEERFLFYNPLKEEFVMGAKRIKTFSIGEIPTHYPYAFSCITFFDSIKDEKWNSFGNETIAFEYLLVQKNKKQMLYYCDNIIEIKDVKVPTYKHSYKYKLDDNVEWEQLFGVIGDSISKKEVQKVVISREIEIQCNTTVNIDSVLQNLLENNPNCFVFAYFKDGKTFLGATPEVLVQKEKDDILSYALAGTIARNGNNDELQKEKLLNDEKNLYEHQIVIHSIVDVMKNYNNEIKVDETGILKLKNLLHLCTPIYTKDNKDTLFDWVRRLHPTPALGGMPSEKALKLIKQHEKHERGLYAAPIGVMDENGNGIFVVGIRSALIQGSTVYAYAGCGVVKGSDCENEYTETENKLRTIIESL